MRLYFIAFLLLVLSCGNLNSQEGSKIDLRNVNVGTKRLPTIFLFGEEYTARNRDDLLRGILKSQFYRPDLNIIINLEEFISKSGARGSYMVYRSKNEDEELGIDEI